MIDKVGLRPVLALLLDWIDGSTERRVIAEISDEMAAVQAERR